MGAVIWLHFMSVLTPLILFNASYTSPLILCLLFSTFLNVFFIQIFVPLKNLRPDFTKIHTLTSGKDFGIEELHIFSNKAILKQICQ